MIFRTLALILVASIGSGCRFFDTQTSPSTDTTPLPISLSGVVTASGAAGAPVKGATIQILDGVNKGLVTTTDAKGAYKFENVSAGNANVQASRDGFPDAVAGVYINTGSTLDFQMDPPPWSARGTGSDVFEIPTWVSRVRVDGEYTGSTTASTGAAAGTGTCETVAIRLEGRSIANLTLGTCAGGITRYQGVHLMSGGGMVEIFSLSTKVSWRLEWLP
jgi:hypothetical protein